MPEFNDIQAQLNTAKIDQKQAERTALLSKEKLRKLGRKKDRLLRNLSPDDTKVQELFSEEKALKTQISRDQTSLGNQIRVTEEIFSQFQPFTDPREHIQNFSDDYPIMLFPVRLETRFKEITLETGSVRPQLWVRVFPDECSVDTFENILSEAEVKKAKEYWASIWSTGDSVETEIQSVIISRKKAAWRNLAGNFQSGRAYWITQNYIPLNMAELPIRESESDVILSITTEELPSASEQEAIKMYWTSIWLAGSDLTRIKEAGAQLITVVGSEESARELINTFRPYNIKDIEVPREDPPKVTVNFVLFSKSETVDTRQSSWSQAAKITTLPEKFVLLGYKGTDESGNPIQVLNELGAPIPDPLIIGPNPSVDTNDVLKKVLVLEYEALITTTEKETKLNEYYQQFKDSEKSLRTIETFISDFLNLPEPEVPMALESVFDDFKDEVKAAKYIEYLSQRSETKWLFDFEEAVRNGMGFKVDLTPSVYRLGFDRLYVLGIKIGDDATTAKNDLEELIRNHHYGSSGFSILPQGTPTNNTEDNPSGFSENEESESSFDRYFSEENKEDPDDFLSKKDGRWLSELLGIDPDASSLKFAKNYYHTDQCEAKAMNIALWNATIGYFMESMMTPVFSEEQHNVVREFFIEHIRGRGNLPAIRIGDQPYGILSTSKLKESKWLFQDDKFATSNYANSIKILQQVHEVTIKIREDFETKLNKVAYVGKEGADPHQTLLDVLGLHATSVEFHQRMGESFAQLFNRMNYDPAGADMFREKLMQGFPLLAAHGYIPTEKDDMVPILEKFFLSKANALSGDLIDDVPLSEKQPIRPYTEVTPSDTESENYIYWLIKQASTNFNAIKRQQGFADGVPNALLYQMLRHSLSLEFSNTAFDLYRKAEIMGFNAIREAKIDEDFIGVKVGEKGFESRYEFLERQEPRITDQAMTVADYIAQNIDLGIDIGNFNNMMQALNHLKDVPTARLERAFVEHLDCCTYRLDAWLMGFANLQLSLMRQSDNLDEPESKKGIYLGAFGWVEDLSPDDETLEPVSLEGELDAIFNPDGDMQLVKDNNNMGYIHAPSINQAVTAAVLRNAYISEATPEDPEVYKINLSSERVRMALSMIEGIQQGQRMGALLGYQLERGLHDRYGEDEVDIFIYELRKYFPLQGNSMNETFENEDDIDSITQIEARNVVDGLRLVKHVNDTKNFSYPFGKPMRFATEPEYSNHRRIVEEEVERLRNINDAVADLAMAEGVHQVVQANYDRAAGVMDAYSKGGFPPTPEVIRTPRSGLSLTNRIGIHLKPGIIVVDPSHSRARLVAEPAINQWLETLLPNISDLCCRVRYSLPSYAEEITNPTNELIVSAADLGLTPIDLLYMLDVGTDKSLTALDEYILKFVHETVNPRPDVKLEIRYTETIDNKINFFEIAPLIKSLRSLVLGSRPLKPSDIALPAEATTLSDSNCTINLNRIETVFTTFKKNFKDATDVVQGLKLLEDPFMLLFDAEDFDQTMTQKNAIIDTIDALINQLKGELYDLSQFGIAQAGFGFIYDRKATLYSEIYKKVIALKDRWLKKQKNYNELIDEKFIEPGLPDTEKMEILRKAERLISTSYINPSSDPLITIPGFKSGLDDKFELFEDKLLEISTWLDGTFLDIKPLVDSLITLKTGTGSTTGKALSEFDLLPLEIEEDERQMVVLGEDLTLQLIQLSKTLVKRALAVEQFFAAYAAEVDATARIKIATEAVKQLFGDEFKIIPEFELDPIHSAELKKAFQAKEQILDYQHNELDVDFPMDDWLYSIARVRGKMGDWENMVVLAEGFGSSDIELVPLQLPYKDNDNWLGLSFPDTYEIDKDRLLYTAYLNTFDENLPQCGLLVDEWTEVIPTEKETTGLTFQYDQPNAEPPQSMLLAMPTSFKGKWEWSELVDTLHETLDLAKLRALEPVHIDETPYAQFLPATISAVTTYPFINIALNYAINNGFGLNIDDNG